MLLEKDLAVLGRRTVKIVVTFLPIGFWRKIKCWFGTDFPGPILFEIEIGGAQLKTFEKRIKNRKEIKEEVICTLIPGRGKIKILMNPADFNKKWKLNFKMDVLYN